MFLKASYGGCQTVPMRIYLMQTNKKIEGEDDIQDCDDNVEIDFVAVVNKSLVLVNLYCRQSGQDNDDCASQIWRPFFAESP